MAQVITDAEIEQLRWLLGYGNITVGGYPYTPDGYFELFRNVVAEYLSTGAETTAAVAITAAGIATVTPASMTGIVTHARLVIDVGEDEETVVVRATTATTFSARFALAHAAPFAIQVESGVTRLRQLLRDASAAYRTLTGSTITQSAGLKMVGQGEVEWFNASATLTTVNEHYRSIVMQISDLVRVPPRWMTECEPRLMETY